MVQFEANSTSPSCTEFDMLNTNSKCIFSKEQIVMHMPHCSIAIPDYSGYVVSKDIIDSEISKSTDWGVDEIFEIQGIEKIRFDYSREFCDVERFYDDGEPLSKIGFGIVYTSLEDGRIMRELSKEKKAEIIANYYEPHHLKFTEKVREKLDKFGEVLILDCHSFPGKPLMWEEYSDLKRPEICIGTESFHTPFELRDHFSGNFESMGYTVAENQPFIGTIVPSKFYKKDNRVNSIMIEINRSLFMDEKTLEINKEATSKIRDDIENILKGMKND